MSHLVNATLNKPAILVSYIYREPVVGFSYYISSLYSLVPRPHPQNGKGSGDIRVWECWDGGTGSHFSQHFAGVDGTRLHFSQQFAGTGSHFPSILLGWMELGPTFPSNLLGWMELGPTFLSILLG